MRHLAITGIETASWISRILSGSAMRATPPSRRMSAGTRSSAITATAPASSAMRACSASVTSMITPPFSISARPLLTLIVPVSAIAMILATLAKPLESAYRRSAAQPRAKRRANERRGSRHHQGQGSGEALLEPRSATPCRAQRLVPGARLAAPSSAGRAEEGRPPRPVPGPGGGPLPPLPELVRAGARQDRRLLLVRRRRLGRRADGQAPAADVPGRRPPALGDRLDDEGQAEADEHPLQGGRDRRARA